MSDAARAARDGGAVAALLARKLELGRAVHAAITAAVTAHVQTKQDALRGEVFRMAVLKSAPGGARQAMHRSVRAARAFCTDCHAAPKTRTHCFFSFSPCDRDVRPQPHRWREDYPLSVILCLQNGTSIVSRAHSLGADPATWGGETCTTADAGDLICFHPSLVHCGVSYDAQNVRIHAVIKTALTVWPGAQTQIV